MNNLEAGICVVILQQLQNTPGPNPVKNIWIIILCYADLKHSDWRLKTFYQTECLKSV